MESNASYIIHITGITALTTTLVQSFVDGKIGIDWNSFAYTAGTSGLTFCQAIKKANRVIISAGFMNIYSSNYNFQFSSNVSLFGKIDFTIQFDGSANEGMSSYATKIKAVVSLLKDDTSVFLELPCPSEYSGSSTTIVDSGRNTKGYVLISPIRSNIAKIEITWNYLSIEEYSKIAMAFENAYGGSLVYKVCFFNATIGCYDIREMYVNDREFNTAQIALANGMPVGYQEVPIHLIEV